MRSRTPILSALLLVVALVALVGGLGATSGAWASQFQDKASTAVGQADAPAWQFTVLTFQDPYKGTLQQPAKPLAGMRYVGAEVQITNGSDQALDFFGTDVKLNEASGIEFRAGDVIGSEPRLRGRNLNPGERARGWVWYEVPTGSKLTRLTFVAPGPEFRVDLPANPGA